MQLRQLLPAFLACGGLASAFSHVDSFVKRDNSTSKPKFLNSNTSKFAVNSTGVPEVDFDVGESYAGQLPISNKTDEQNKLFWWFFPSENPAAEKEIVIWLNGGPGCSSIAGLVRENGPFRWQPGTYKPVRNYWGWQKLSNIVWIDQPVGTGFSTGTPTAKDQHDIAEQFLGFWKNFIETFGMQGYKVYITGESYAGMYGPYIGSAMLDAKDETYFVLKGLMLYDPLIGQNDAQGALVAQPFAESWGGLFPFNDTYRAQLREMHQSCGYADYLDKYLTFPASGQQPQVLPGVNASGMPDGPCSQLLYSAVIMGAYEANPCFDIYNVQEVCPSRYDVLGAANSFPDPAGAPPTYFNRPGVREALHAPLNTTWLGCADPKHPVLVGPGGVDQSPPSLYAELPRVIDATKNVMIAQGALDYRIIGNGTLLTIQNMTWGGKLGFDAAPTQPFNVPRFEYDLADPNSLVEMSAGAGVLGKTHTERGFTYVTVEMSGHMVPKDQPAAAFRNLEFLLGRVGSLNGTEPFTIGAGSSGGASNGTASGGGENNSTAEARSAPPTSGAVHVAAPTMVIAAAAALFGFLLV